MRDKLGKKIIYFFCGLGLLGCLAFLRTNFSGDTNFSSCRLQPGGTETRVFDVGQQGFIKYWLQPEVLSLHLSCTTKEQLPLTCSVEGFDSYYLSQGSKKKGDWYQLQPQELLARRGRSHSMPVNIELELPRKAIEQALVAEGSLVFFHAGEKYSTIKITIINSKY